MRYSIWCHDDCSGFEADTIQECFDIIENEIWWTGVFEIVENRSGETFVTKTLTDCTKGYRKMLEDINGAV